VEVGLASDVEKPFLGFSDKILGVCWMQDWMSVFLQWMQQQREEWLRYTARTVYWMQHRVLAIWPGRVPGSYHLPGGVPTPGLGDALTLQRNRPAYSNALNILGPDLAAETFPWWFTGKYYAPGY